MLRGGAAIRCNAWFGLLDSAVSAKCIWPLQGKNRLLPCLLVPRPAIVPDDELAAAGRAAKADARPGTAQDVKPMLELSTTRTPGKNHREQLQDPVERTDQGKIDAYPT